MRPLSLVMQCIDRCSVCVCRCIARARSLWRQRTSAQLILWLVLVETGMCYVREVGAPLAEEVGSVHLALSHTPEPEVRTASATSLPVTGATGSPRFPIHPQPSMCSLALRVTRSVSRSPQQPGRSWLDLPGGSAHVHGTANPA
jgi:hypothetical protein